MHRDHTSEHDPTAPVSEQASFWWVLLNEGNATAADQRAFVEWVTRSPERVEAYLQVARLAMALRSDATQWPDLPAEDLIRAARASQRDVTNLPHASSHRKRDTHRWPHVTTSEVSLLRHLTRPRIVALCVAVLAAIAFGFHTYTGPQRLETVVGEQRSVVLSDGSLVVLNTSSIIEVDMAKHHRTVRLLAGEALFKVAHDAARPFDVTSSNTTVRAVGTQFNVDRRFDSTTVTVVDGRVAVFTTGVGATEEEQTRVPLAAGEQLTLAPRSARHPVRADVATALAWTQRKLVFENRRLGEVADEFNRYNRQAIEIRSPELREQRVTGVFQANDPASFLTFLSRQPGVIVAGSNNPLHVVVTQGAEDATD